MARAPLAAPFRPRSTDAQRPPNLALLQLPPLADDHEPTARLGETNRLREGKGQASKEAKGTTRTTVRWSARLLVDLSTGASSAEPPKRQHYHRLNQRTRHEQQTSGRLERGLKVFGFNPPLTTGSESTASINATPSKLAGLEEEAASAEVKELPSRSPMMARAGSGKTTPQSPYDSWGLSPEVMALLAQENAKHEPSCPMDSSASSATGALTC